MYEIGTLKLTWIEPTDFTILKSQMYGSDELNKALRDAESKPDWMLFQLQKTENDSYTWKLLPYGTAKTFERSMRIRNSAWYPIVIVGGIGLAAYLILDKASQLIAGK